MNNPAQFDRTILSAVKPGIDATLCELNAQLEQFLTNPVEGIPALSRAQSELHRLLGVFKMIHLDGLAVFCTEFEAVLNELASTPQITSALHRDELLAALVALTRYLDDLAQGADNTTLRLFANYQQMQQLRGLEMSFDLDLFFPNLSVQLPSSVLDLVQFPDFNAYFKAARNYYQQGLLKYLRQDDTPSALKLMQQAVNVAMTAMPADDSRAFWWICSGLIDCVSRDGLPADLSAQKVFGRIDQQMRSVIAGTPAPVQPLLNEMLYLVGRSHNVSEIVASIKQTYALDRYFPELTTLSPAELAKNLGVVRELLRSTEEQWELCVQGDQSACANFVTQTKLIAQQNETLELNTLQYLAQQIAKFSTTLNNEENIQRLSMDMAIALLLMGSGIAHYRELDSSFQEQVRLLSERMQAEIDDEPLEAEQLRELVDLYCQTERNDALFILSKEMLINLEQTENGLNGLFGEAAKRDELDNVHRWLKQVQGGLQVSSLRHAAQLLEVIHETIRSLTETDAIIHPADSRTVASALSQLEEYLQQLSNGHENQIEGLLASINELVKLRQPEPVQAPVATTAIEPPARSSEDQELLEIFLEEATEVLEIMRANLEIIQLNPTNLEALITIRRGFHTLKGSGRMVGLVEIGEVAWAAESAMNKWLQDNKPAVQQLIEFIAQAIQHFSTWVDALGARGYAHIEADGLVKFAQRIEDLALGNAPKVETTPVVLATPVVQPPAPTPEPVKVDTSDSDVLHIGDKVLSVSLFRIGSEEAKQHAAALRACFVDLNTNPALLVQYDFMRAAHTLAGVNRAMGFSAIVELAFALESWLQARIEQPSVLRDAEKPMLDKAIAALEDMTQRLCNHELPASRDDLVLQLRLNREPLSVIAAPVETAMPVAVVDTFASFFEQPTLEPVVAATSAPAMLFEVETPKPAVAADDFAAFFEQATIEPVVAATSAPTMLFEVETPKPAVDDFAAFFEQATLEPVVTATSAPTMLFEVETPKPAVAADDFAAFFEQATLEPVVAATSAPAMLFEVETPKPAVAADDFAAFFEQATLEPVVAATSAPAMLFEVETPKPAVAADDFAAFFEQATLEPVVAETSAPAMLFEVETPKPAVAADDFAAFFKQPTLELEPVVAEVSTPIEAISTTPTADMLFEPVAPEPVTAEVTDNFAVSFEHPTLELEPVVAEEHPPTVLLEVETPKPIADAFADLFNHEVIAERATPIAAMPAEPAPLPVATPKEVVIDRYSEQLNIGGKMLSRTLFDVGSDEAKQNVLVLRRCFNELKSAPVQVVQYDFMRAAHTLVGVNRAMGIPPIVELAFALESWLQTRIEQSSALQSSEQPLIDQAIAALESMTLSLCNQEMPATRNDLVGQLRLGKEPISVVSTPVTAQPAFVEPTEPAEEVDLFAALFDQAKTPTKAAAQTISPDIAKLFELATPAKPVQPQSVSPVAPVAVSVQPPATPADQGADERTNILQIRDDVDEQLLPVFLEEADELLPKISECLRAWRETPSNEPQSNLLKRLLHTMKGSSRMAGAMRIGELSHELESRVLAVAKLKGREGYWDGLEHELDRISGLVEELRTGEISPLEIALNKVLDQVSAEEGVEAEDADTHNVVRDNRRTTERVALGNMLRVRADVVDRLVNEAGEISVTRSRMETELRIFKESLMELTGSVTRLRQQLREVEIQAESQMQARITLSQEDDEHFDPLEFDRFTRLQELTRFMNESVHDVQTVQQTLLKNLDETAAAMSAQARLNRDLQQRLMSVRMVPFNSISERLYRIVRQTGKDLQKRANLELQGGQVELDRGVLEKMTAPFEHLLRNAIAHGLENESQRARTSKPTIGEIRLTLHQENNEVVFELSDDGNGLNYEALRQKAITLGLGKTGEMLNEQQLAQLIFVSGVSTATEVSAIAGRGIGMDVVRSEIAGLGGRIDVSSTAGVGTRFTIHLPLTLAVMQTLMVRSGESIFAIPATMVEQVVQLKPDAMSTLHTSRQFEAQGKVYPLHYLPTLLGDEHHVVENHLRNSILLLRSSEQRVALHVDELLGRQEAVVKNIGPQLARLIGVAGATVRGDGEVVLILNPVQMAQRVATSIHKAVAAVPEALRTQPLIMVVDDSLTVRKITSRLLLRAGYQVATATDGMNALEQLGEITPDVMLLDVEMPRMDGFELTKNIRRNPRMKQFPIIMITSRTADKHRDYAMELGVNAYLGKPYQEDDLLSRIAAFVEAAHA